MYTILNIRHAPQYPRESDPHADMYSMPTPAFITAQYPNWGPYLGYFNWVLFPVLVSPSLHNAQIFLVNMRCWQEGMDLSLWF